MDRSVRSCSLPLALSVCLSVSLCFPFSSRQNAAEVVCKDWLCRAEMLRAPLLYLCGLKMQVDLLTDGVLEHLLGSSADFIRSKGSLPPWNRRLLPGDAVSRLDALPEKRPQQHKTCGGPSLLSHDRFAVKQPLRSEAMRLQKLVGHSETSKKKTGSCKTRGEKAWGSLCGSPDCLFSGHQHVVGHAVS